MDIIDQLNPGTKSYEEDYRNFLLSKYPYEQKFGKMMLDFCEKLRRDVVGPQLFAMKVTNELWLSYSSHTDSTAITATIDSNDFSPLVNGVPQMHYRLTYTKPSQKNIDAREKIEFRTHNIDTACEFVLDAMRNCKFAPE